MGIFLFHAHFYWSLPIINLYLQEIRTFMKDNKYFTFIDQDNNVCIDFEELKAINKQIEELGWDNE